MWVTLFLFSVGGDTCVVLRFFIRLKFSGLDYGFTMEDPGMCIIFCLVEMSAQIFVFLSKIGLLTKLETFLSNSFVGRLIKSDKCFWVGRLFMGGILICGCVVI